MTSSSPSSPELLAVQEWLQMATKSFQHLTLFDARTAALHSDLLARLLEQRKLRKAKRRDTTWGAPEDSNPGVRTEQEAKKLRAQAHQLLCVLVPLERMVAVAMEQAMARVGVRSGRGIAEFLMCRVLKQPPIALKRPLTRDEARKAMFFSEAVTLAQQHLAKELIAAHPALFPRLPEEAKAPLLDEQGLRERTHRQAVVGERTAILDKVQVAGVLSPKEMAVLRALV